MKRIHLFEIEDLSWFPSFLRNFATDFLQFGANKFDAYKGAVPLISDALKKSNTSQIIDIASGGGGGLLKLAEHLKALHPDLKIKLTDYYPNVPAFERTCALMPEVFDFVKEPVNALNVDPTYKGLRTQFLSLHHFRPNDAIKILNDAVKKQQSIAIFEAQQRDVPSFIRMLFSPITLWLMTPFIRPFSVLRLLFTYLIPILPVMVLWDGIVSVLRTYDENELKALIDQVENKDKFEWKIGFTDDKPVKVGYLIGVPKQ